MTALEIVYVASFIFGLAYTVISTIMGVGHGDAGFGASGDLSGSGDIGAGHNGDGIHFSPLSPVVIAMFLTAFGAAGMICLKVFQVQTYLGLAVAILAGLGVAVVTFFVFVTLFHKTQSSSESRISSLIGQEAEVITPIPAEGVGEIAYTSKGARYTAPAKSSAGTDISSHSIVFIEKIVGNMFIVKRSDNP
jgi:membrane protein implicated in regulation of membrane protease activity